jgi:hypothetical protein
VGIERFNRHAFEEIAEEPFLRTMMGIEPQQHQDDEWREEQKAPPAFRIAKHKTDESQQTVLAGQCSVEIKGYYLFHTGMMRLTS